MEEISSGIGYGFGDGGYSFGYGDGGGGGYSDGSGNGSGYGSGYGGGGGGTELVEITAGGGMTADMVLSLEDLEVRRLCIEALGPERLAEELEAQVVHADLDARGNNRRLLRIPLADAEAGYVQVVVVTCPSTGRVYHLGVPPTVETCADAVAATFGLKAGSDKPVARQYRHGDVLLTPPGETIFSPEWES